MKRLLFFGLLSFVVGAVSAQGVKVHVGATSAVNATFVLDKGLTDDPRYNSTLTYNFAPIGFNFGVDLSRKFGISLEGIKSAQGQIYQLLDVAKNVKGERRIDLEYIQLPLMLRFMSGGDAAARANFNLGPQMSFLTDARESIQAGAGTYAIPEGMDLASIQAEFPTATAGAQPGTYTLDSDVPSRDLLTKEARNFRNSEFSLAAAFGVDIDLSRHLYLTTQIRANYSLTDMRNGEVIDRVRAGEGGSLFGERANVLVGVQLGLHWMFGTTRSFQNR